MHSTYNGDFGVQIPASASMTGNDPDSTGSVSMGSSGPRIEATDAEKQQRAVDSLNMKTSSNRIIIGIPAIRDYLSKYGLDVDSNGFITDQETGELAEPAVYDAEAFQSAPQPNDYNISAYFAPTSTVAFEDKSRIHLSDLHTVIEIDSEPYPVLDNVINVKKAHRDTGIMFRVITAWSAARGITDTKAGTDEITINMTDEYVTELSCLRCQFTANHIEWNGETNTPVCPECDSNWDVTSISKCSNCNTKHVTDAISGEENMFCSTLQCPACDAESKQDEPLFTTQTRYYSFEE